MYDVAVIGAGVVGAMIARELSRFNLKICIVEKDNDVANGATKANSGIVHAGFDAEPGTLKAKLNVEGSLMMEKIAEELSVKYVKNGSLVVGFNEEDRKTLKGLLERGIKNGVSGLEIIEREELLKLEPNIGESVKMALYAPTGAIICPYGLAIAAIGNAMDNGAELIRNFKVSSISYNDGVYTVVSDNNDKIASKYIINAAGVYSEEIAKMIGDDSIKIIPRRGEYILLDKECMGLVSHTVFNVPGKMGKGILVSPTADGNILTGPTSVNIDDKDNKDTTIEGFTDIISKSCANIRNIRFNKSITSFCGLRSVGNTGDFIINSPKNGFINAAGIESPGLSSSPAIAVMVRNMLADMGLSLNEKPSFNPYRKSPHFFKDASLEEKNAIIAKDKNFGKIVCRCETITEGEILFALNQNPKPYDLDGVKRRTRAQMGRCQGGFCSPKIVELISKVHNIPYEAVTKSGGDSYINVGKTKEEQND